MKPDTKAIRARADAATAGPWTRYCDRLDGKSVDVALMKAGRPGDVCRYEPGSITEADAVFVALARTDVPALCDRVEALELAVEKLAQFCEREGLRDSAAELRKALL